MSLPAWYEPRGDGRYVSTPHTAGPWSADAQHGSPPAALLTGLIEATEPRPELILARVTVEILGSVPVAELTSRARVIRPGRSVELVEAALSAGARDVATARGWRIRRTEDSTGPGEPPPAIPESTGRIPGFSGGYLESVEWRPIGSGMTRPGPATVWTRLRGCVVADADPTPTQRVVGVADSGNGVSWIRDLRSTWFINPELTVHLHREPVGEWVLLDAETTMSAGGAGLATSRLSDQDGLIGHGAQALYVAPRT